MKTSTRPAFRSFVNVRRAFADRHLARLELAEVRNKDAQARDLLIKGLPQSPPPPVQQLPDGYVGSNSGVVMRPGNEVGALVPQRVDVNQLSIQAKAKIDRADQEIRSAAIVYARRYLGPTLEGSPAHAVAKLQDDEPVAVAFFPGPALAIVLDRHRGDHFSAGTLRHWIATTPDGRLGARQDDAGKIQPLDAFGELHALELEHGEDFDIVKLNL
jgi:hypothetical protein